MSSRGIFEKIPGSGFWWIRYADASGRIRREKAGTKTTAEKLYFKRKAEALVDKKLPELSKKKPVTFNELAEDALAYSRAHKRSFQHDEYRMKALEAAFGPRAAATITPQEIDRWLSQQRREREWAPATSNRIKALFSLVFRLGIENGKLKDNPARLVRRQRESNGRLRFLSPEEETRLREVLVATSRERVPEFELALHTGMRRSEQYGLTWDRVDFDRQLVTITESKNGELRYVPLNQAALGALRAFKLRSLGVGPVCVTLKGEPIDTPRGWFERAVKLAGIHDFTWHCLRHTFASRLIMAGVDLRTVQQLMGHRTIQMTCRYAHLAPAHQLAAVEKLCPAPVVEEAAGREAEEEVTVQ